MTQANVSAASQSLWVDALSFGLTFFLLSCYIDLYNRPVPWRYAAVGGLFTSLVFEITKYGFRIYVLHIPMYWVVYGTLGVIPCCLSGFIWSGSLCFLVQRLLWCLCRFLIKNVEFDQKSTLESNTNEIHNKTLSL